MTCNQFMVLLDIYRGTFREDRHRHMATVMVDLRRLLALDIITVTGKSPECTAAGMDLVRLALSSSTTESASCVTASILGC